MKSVAITSALHTEFQNFATETGITLETAIAQALNEWMNLQSLCILDTLDSDKAKADKKSKRVAKSIAVPIQPTTLTQTVASIQ
jgi:plasmid maintenance system antidote protein VapI